VSAKVKLELRAPQGLTFQELVLKLMHYWNKQGCVLQQPYDTEVGAGTMHPETFLRVLGPASYRVAFVQPSRRPADGRYGENPNRLYKHFQYQVILKPSPADIQGLYLRSLEAIGIDLRAHDIRFEEDNWESPTLGAWGIGWQVLLDGLEITQFTYFQQSGGIDLDPISVEITYGLERICSFLQRVESKALRSEFELHEKEAKELLDAWKHLVGAPTKEGKDSSHKERGHKEQPMQAASEAAALTKARARYPILAAYDHCLKCSHLFNLMDARGVISTTERAALMQRVRTLACRAAAAYLEQIGGKDTAASGVLTRPAPPGTAARSEVRT